jgi:cyclopropane fatty-acyl-phospholipid synthase-like methyltransferase
MNKETIRPVLTFGRRVQRTIQRMLYSDKYMERTFSKFYHSNHWKDAESVSGTGSNAAQTVEIRKQLPKLIKKLEIKTMLDIPCGDYHWMSIAPLKIDKYIGADIVTKMIEENNKKYADKKVSFVKLDITSDTLPKVDLVLVRDVFVHFSSKDIFKAINNIKSSGSKYLLTTTFTNRKYNIEIETGGWRPINLETKPFNLLKPKILINEKATQDKGKYADKSLGLWRLQDL